MRLPGTLRSLRRGAGRTLEIRTWLGLKTRVPRLGSATRASRAGSGRREGRAGRGGRVAATGARGGGPAGELGRREGGSGEGGAGRLAAAAI